MWKTLSEVRIADILQFVRDARGAGQAVHVGTDSLQSGRFTQFVTVVVILTPTKGGRVAYRREIVPRITSLRERLLQEVWRSVDLGLQFSPIVKGELTVHIDANPVVTHKSSQRPGAGRPGGRPGIQGAHQAGELGGIARSQSRGALAWEAAEKRGRGGLAERRGAGPQNQLAGFDSPTYLEEQRRLTRRDHRAKTSPGQTIRASWSPRSQGSVRLGGGRCTRRRPAQEPSPGGPGGDPLADGPVLAHRDAALARTLPLVFWRQRDGFDLDRLVAQASRRGERFALGLFLELAGRLGHEPSLVQAARRLRDRRRTAVRPFFTRPEGPFLMALTRRYTPRVARRWGYLMSMTVDSFRTLFDKFARMDLLSPSISGVPSV